MLTLPQKNLLDILSAVQGLLAKTGKIHIVATDRLEIVATDNENTIITNTAATVESSFAILIDGRHLFAVVKSLPQGTVTLAIDDRFRLSVDCAPASFKLAGEDPQNAPAMPSLDTAAEFTPTNLHRAIEQVFFGIPNEENRYGLNGAHFEDTGNLRLASTDGSRLQYAETLYTGEVKVPSKILVSKKTLSEIRKLPAPLTIGFQKRAMVVRSESVTLHARLVDGEFPPYRRVLPTGDPKRTIRVDRARMIEALRRVSLEAQDKASTVRIMFEHEEMTISARSIEHGEASHPVSVEMTGDPITMGFNVVFLIEALTAIQTEQVQIGFDEALSPCLIYPIGDDSALFVVMPIRLE